MKSSTGDISDSLLENEANASEPFTLSVCQVGYIPARTFANVVSEKVLNCAPEWEFPFWQRLCGTETMTNYMKPWLMRNQDALAKSVSPLYSISFSAHKGFVTGIVSPDYGERRTIIDLIAGRRKRGSYSGDIILTGSGIHPASTMAMNTGFVPRNSLFIPGLTYISALRYAAQLRMSCEADGSKKNVGKEEIEERLTDVLKLMNLWGCRNETLPESDDEIPERGQLAAQLRRLSIAAEIINFPPLIIIDDPAANLEPALALGIVRSLKALAMRGHIVLIALPKPAPHILSLVDKLVVIGKGVSLYSSPPQDIKTFFCSGSNGYQLKPGVDLMDWVLDIASGIERSAIHRGRDMNPYVLQRIFESSPFFIERKHLELLGYESANNSLTNSRHGDSVDSFSALDTSADIEASVYSNQYSSNSFGEKAKYTDSDKAHSEKVWAQCGVSSFHASNTKFYGYLKFDNVSVLLYRIQVVCIRAFHAKLKEKQNLKKMLGGSVMVGLFIGYLQFRVCHFGKYTMNLLKFPYVNASNATALMFFLGAFVFTQQVLNVQLVCRKVNVFRQEQASGFCSSPAFALASAISEIPFSISYGLIFSYIVYFMSQLNFGWQNLGFFTLLMSCVSIIGLQTAYLFAVLLRHEIVVRDMFLLVVFLQLMLSGFPFQLPVIVPQMKDISQLIPIRWCFEALMTWKFVPNYYDGTEYITPFGFNNFNYYHVFEYYQTFIFVTAFITVILMFPMPNLLHKKVENSERNVPSKWVCSLKNCCSYFSSAPAAEIHRSNGRPSSLDQEERTAWLTDSAAKGALEEGGETSENLDDRLGGTFDSLGRSSSRSGSLSEAVTTSIGFETNTIAYNGTNQKTSYDTAAFPRIATRDLAKPLLYHRESSVTGRGGDQNNPLGMMGAFGVSSRLSIQQTSLDGKFGGFEHGPTVGFMHLSCNIRGKAALNNISGQFDWGKLSVIMGAPESGKSTLLRALAGSCISGAHLSGDVLFDGQKPDIQVPLWQRCALVTATDEQFPSLTVRETVTYAMQLRCISANGLELVQENVNRTLDILHLEEDSETLVYKLEPGQRRRLSIAEEIVHGPALLLIDEATTGLDSIAESVLMRTFREMVNNDRTVICTMHQPNAAVFSLFDTLLLLSHGEIIYHGPAQDAASYFIQKPLSFPFTDYNNPADFLIDISGAYLQDTAGSKANPFALAQQFRRSDGFKSMLRRLSPEKINKGNRKSRYKNVISEIKLGNISDDISTTSEGSIDEEADSGRLTFSRSSQQYDSYSGVRSYGGKGSNIQALTSAALKSTDSSNPIHRSSDEDPSISEAQSSLNKDKKPRGSEIMYDNEQGLFSYCCECLSVSLDACGTEFVGCLSSFFDKDKRELNLLKTSIIIRRAAVGLWQRRALLWGSIITNIFLACFMGAILGDTSGSLYNTITYFAVGILLLMLSNVQLISYLFLTQQVFYKEHSRNLYSTSLYWAVASLPLYILRALSAVLYASISYSLLGLQITTPVTGYFILIIMIAMVSATIMSETIIYAVPDIRTAYQMIPAICFIQFMFSGLFLKPVLLPRWVASWAPSISIIRWTLQGCFINQFQNNKSIFPDLPNYSTFNSFESLYGWGGKTDWYCLSMILVAMVVFKITALISSMVRAYRLK